MIDKRAETSRQFDQVVERCREMYTNKLQDYGASWAVMRASSITDQMYIKLKRIRTLEMVGTSKVGDGIVGELIAVVNYGIMGIIILEKGVQESPEAVSNEEAVAWYDHYIAEAKSLMERKNHDYGEAWREMRLTSITDLMLTKIHRTKQLEDLGGEGRVSEGIDANYYDIVNYAVFALIRILLEGEECYGKQNV